MSTPTAIRNLVLLTIVAGLCTSYIVSQRQTAFNAASALANYVQPTNAYRVTILGRSFIVRPRTMHEPAVAARGAMVIEAALAPPTLAELTPTTDIEAMLFAAADEFGVPRELALAMMTQESGGSPTARSYAGATGLMQIMPTTGAGIAAELGMASYDLNDPQTNARFGAYYIAEKLKRYGSVEWALAAYNWGPASVDGFLSQHPEALTMDWPTIIATWGSEIPAETQGYVTDITAIMSQAQAQVNALPPAPAATGTISEIAPGMIVNADFFATESSAWAGQINGWHTGTDFHAPDGTPGALPVALHIMSVGFYTDDGRRGGYLMGMDDNGIQWYIGHFADTPMVEPGQAYGAGTVVGSSFSYNHFHVQCRYDLNVDGGISDESELVDCEPILWSYGLPTYDHDGSQRTVNRNGLTNTQAIGSPW